MSAARLVRLKAGVTVAQAQRDMAASFRAVGIDSPEADARALLCAALHLSRAQLIAQSDRILETREASVAAALGARRMRREPVARILGVKEFWSLPLRIGPDVLVPRPETEAVVEAALEAIDRAGGRNEALNILDIGTGSGALLLALMSELPHARGIGTDISSAALAIARANAERLQLAPRCTFVVADIAAPLRGPFDLIVSNPPYIARGAIAALDPEVRDYDPTLALDGGADGLDAYRAIASAVGGLLGSDGRLILELGAGQEAPVQALLEAGGFMVATVRADLAGIPRALVAKRRAVAGMPGTHSR
jgi:release factor glutamine methyltransferase